MRDMIDSLTPSKPEGEIYQQLMTSASNQRDMLSQFREGFIPINTYHLANEASTSDSLVSRSNRIWEQCHALIGDEKENGREMGKIQGEMKRELVRMNQAIEKAMTTTS